MRHPHGLRAAAGGGIVLPAIGASFEGGFFAGTISHTANGVATHALIVAPAATGGSGDGYTIITNLAWKTSNTSTIGVSSTFNGSANSANMNNANHPAAQFCEGLSISGYTDWYLPARDELDIAYQNLKPTSTSNNTVAGKNAYSVPKRTVDRTAGNPAQTSVAAFQEGGAQAFPASIYSPPLSKHWSSTELDGSEAVLYVFDNGGNQPTPSRTFTFRTRAFRKIAL